MIPDSVKIIKLRRQLRDERQTHVQTLEKLKEIKIHDQWIAETNSTIAKINETIRKSNNWDYPGAKHGSPRDDMITYAKSYGIEID